MNKLQKESNTRSLIKGLTWRIIGTIDSFIIAVFVGNSQDTAKWYAASELLSKFLLYFLHERLWQWILNGRVSKAWHMLIKTLSWRIVGTLDSMVLAALYFKDYKIGLQIAGIELLTKLILYYIHELIWNKIPRGTFRSIWNKKK